MIYLKTALLMLRKNMLTNFLTILQMAAVLCVSAVMISSVYIRCQYYVPFRDYYESNGIFVSYNYYANSDAENYALPTMMETEDFLNELENSENMLSCYSAMLFYPENYDYAFRTISYDTEIIRRYQPELQEGRWLQITHDKNRAEAVVSENAYGWRVGDVITLGSNNFPEPAYFEVEIVGMLEENAKIAGDLDGTGKNADCNSFYTTYSYAVEQTPILLFSHEALEAIENYEGSQSDAAVPQAVRYGSLLKLEDSATAEESSAVMTQLRDYGGCFAENMTTVQENSKAYMTEQIQRLLPIIIIVFLLVVVSSVSGSALSTKKHLRHYVIYAINGLSWNRCVRINFVQTIILLGVSLGLAILSLFIIHTMTDAVEIVFSGLLIGAYGIISLMYVLISMVMPIAMLRQNTPKQLLTR